MLSLALIPQCKRLSNVSWALPLLLRSRRKSKTPQRVCWLQEEQYTERVSGLDRKVYEHQAAASQYMLKLDSICRLHKVINAQDLGCLPQCLRSGQRLYKASTNTTLQHEREASRLLQLLHLLVTESKSNAHMLAALWFLHGFCQPSSKLVRRLSQCNSVLHVQDMCKHRLKQSISCVNSV